MRSSWFVCGGGGGMGWGMGVGWGGGVGVWGIQFIDNMGILQIYTIVPTIKNDQMGQSDPYHIFLFYFHRHATERRKRVKSTVCI